MFDRLFKIFRAESDNSQLGILVVVSVILQLVLNEFGHAIFNSIIHFISSWIIAYIFTKVFKSYNFSLVQWWKRFYIIIIVVSLISFLFF